VAPPHPFDSPTTSCPEVYATATKPGHWPGHRGDGISRCLALSSLADTGEHARVLSLQAMRISPSSPLPRQLGARARAASVLTHLARPCTSPRRDHSRGTALPALPIHLAQGFAAQFFAPTSILGDYLVARPTPSRRRALWLAKLAFGLRPIKIAAVLWDLGVRSKSSVAVQSPASLSSS
jgi:hypothetical protein